LTLNFLGDHRCLEPNEIIFTTERNTMPLINKNIFSEILCELNLFEERYHHLEANDIRDLLELVPPERRDPPSKKAYADLYIKMTSQDVDGFPMSQLYFSWLALLTYLGDDNRHYFTGLKSLLNELISARESITPVTKNLLPTKYQKKYQSFHKGNITQKQFDIFEQRIMLVVLAFEHEKLERPRTQFTPLSLDAFLKLISRSSFFKKLDFEDSWFMRNANLPDIKKIATAFKIAVRSGLKRAFSISMYDLTLSEEHFNLIISFLSNSHDIHIVFYFSGSLKPLTLNDFNENRYNNLIKIFSSNTYLEKFTMRCGGDEIASLTDLKWNTFLTLFTNPKVTYLAINASFDSLPLKRWLDFFETLKHSDIKTLELTDIDCFKDYLIKDSPWVTKFHEMLDKTKCNELILLQNNLMSCSASQLNVLLKLIQGTHVYALLIEQSSKSSELYLQFLSELKVSLRQNFFRKHSSCLGLTSIINRSFFTEKNRRQQQLVEIDESELFQEDVTLDLMHDEMAETNYTRFHPFN
jgi:hypothetical protein